jgi:hypothetical protein
MIVRYSDRDGGRVRKIPLTQGQIALVDDEDYETVSTYRWHFKAGRRTGYARTEFRDPDGIVTSIYMHSLLMGVDPDGRQVDHRDLDGLNNQRSNLRWATRAQQVQNISVRRDCAAGLKGVYRKNKKWRATIVVSGKRTALGSFSTKEEAGRAYDAKAVELFGEFARLNFPKTEAPWQAT